MNMLEKVFGPPAKTYLKWDLSHLTLQFLATPRLFASYCKCLIAVFASKGVPSSYQV